jgi:hypothetical protein
MRKATPRDAIFPSIPTTLLPAVTLITQSAPLSASPPIRLLTVLAHQRRSGFTKHTRTTSSQGGFAGQYFNDQSIKNKGEEFMPIVMHPEIGGKFLANRKLGTTGVALLLNAAEAGSRRAFAYAYN